LVVLAGFGDFGSGIGFWLMAGDAKQKARADVRRAQAKVERAQDQIGRARAARRESFERARKAGLSLAEIAAAADLHRSRVDQIIRGA
jgi:hypothetical protein